MKNLEGKIEHMILFSFNLAIGFFPFPNDTLEKYHLGKVLFLKVLLMVLCLEFGLEVVLASFLFNQVKPFSIYSFSGSWL